MEDVRLPLPAAYLDVAFLACVHDAATSTELIKNFDRLYGRTLHTKRTREDLRAFAEFVHFSIYTRLSPEAIQSLRDEAMARQEA